MPPERPYLSVIIPAYNAAEFIAHSILEIDEALVARPFSYEIIVVNDGSHDNTAEVVRKMAESGAVRHLKLVDNPENKGKGGVVRQGMLLAAGQYRLFTDADNATSIDHFDRMIPKFEEGCQVVIASRALKDSRLDPPEPWYRQIAGKMSNLLIQAVLLPGLWDTQCGFKAFTAEAAERVFTLSKLSRWAFDFEVLALARKMGYRVAEVPVRWVHDGRSTVKLSAYLQSFADLARIRWWLWTGRYDLSPSPTRNPS